MSAKNLGKGLNALLGDDEVDEKSDGVKTVSLSDLETSPFQPRHVFNQEAINDLVESIRTKGVLQPLIVRHKNGTKKYEIVGGERRWRASQLAGLKEVPVIIKDLSDKEALEVALIENLQRQYLNALEEAEGYRRLMEEFANTQEELAQAVGKSRSHIANTLRLLGLPDKVKKMLENGSLTSGHARALLTAKDPDQLAEMIVEKGLNVRQTEKLAQENTPKKKRSVSVKNTDKQEECASLAEGLSRILGISVLIKPKAVGGELVLHYKTLEQLDTLIRKLSAQLDSHRKVTASDENTILNEEDVIQAEDEEIGDIVFDDSFSDELNGEIINSSTDDEI